MCVLRGEGAWFCLFSAKANRLESLEPLTVLTGAALNGPLSFPWNLAVSEALLSSISCLSAGGFEERGPALGGTLADCLSPTLPVFLSLIAQPLQKMISSLFPQAWGCWRQPCVCVCAPVRRVWCFIFYCRKGYCASANLSGGVPQTDQRCAPKSRQQHREFMWIWVTVLKVKWGW